MRSSPAKRDLPGTRLEVIDGCGHYPPLEHPEQFAELTRAFIAALPA